MNPTISVWRTGVSPQHFTRLAVSPRFGTDLFAIAVDAIGVFGDLSSHPLDSNQNLLGFNQARRPTTQEWEMGRTPLYRQRASVTWVPAGTLIVIALRLSEIGPRAKDAPRASMRSRSSRPHRSRIESRTGVFDRESQSL